MSVPHRVVRSRGPALSVSPSWIGNKFSLFCVVFHWRIYCRAATLEWNELVCDNDIIRPF